LSPLGRFSREKDGAGKKAYKFFVEKFMKRSGAAQIKERHKVQGKIKEG